MTHVFIGCGAGVPPAIAAETAAPQFLQIQIRMSWTTIICHEKHEKTQTRIGIVTAAVRGGFCGFSCFSWQMFAKPPLGLGQANS